MKNFKSFMITILVGILSLFGLYTNVLAETAPKTFKTKDPVILTDYIEGAPKVHYKEIDGGILVYCQNEALVYQGKYTMKLYSQIDDGFIYILENKPNTGDKSKDYYAMQIAIWWYEDILNNNNVNIPRNVKINVLKKVNEDTFSRSIYNLVNGAKYYSQKKDVSITVNTNNTKFNLSGNHYISEDIMITFVGDKVDVLLKNAPKNAEIINKTVKDGVITFNVKVPVSSLEKGKTTTFSVEATSTRTIKSVYNYFFSKDFQKIVYGKVFTNDVGKNASLTLSISVPEEKKYEISISKTDITGEKEIPGATLNLKGDNNTNLTWVSTSKSHKVTLKPGYYKLTETIAPKGYVLSKETIEFKLDENGNIFEKNTNGEYVKVNRIKMVNEKEIKEYDINISKTDITGEKEIPGATLNLKGDNNTNLTWVSTSKSHKVTLKPGYYSLTETIAPKGYILSKETIEFRIDDDGNLYQKNLAGEYVKVDCIKMINEVRPTINVNKLDSKTNKYVSGATLNIKNNKGEVVASYVTDDKAYYISLEEGEYSLVEIAAPNGYKLNSVPIEFKVDADGNLYIKNSNNEYVKANGIILYNDPVEIIIPDVPKTGLSSAITYIVGSITLLGGAIILIRNGKKC